MTATTGWAPELGTMRLLADGRCSALLSRDAAVEWWCAPALDDSPLCWRLLDPDGGTARFPDLRLQDASEEPAPLVARTHLRGPHGTVEVHDALLPDGEGVLLVRMLRRRSGGEGPVAVRHLLRLGGFDRPALALAVDGTLARGPRPGGGTVEVRAARHVLGDEGLLSEVDVSPDRWTALVVAVDTTAPGDAEGLHTQALDRERREVRRLGSSWLPGRHQGRALDALAVVRACTYDPTGAVVAAPTTSLPEAPGHDRQFDYRYSWLRDASLSTAVAALLGQAGDAAAHLAYVHRAWPQGDLQGTPVRTVRGGDVPDEREVDGVRGWAGSQPVRTGNAARAQRQDDGAGLFVEAVSVHLQVGGALDDATWDRVRALADAVAAEDPHEVALTSGTWELRRPAPLVDGDLGRWLVLDRALWIARGWRPWTRRRRWKRARDVIAARVLGALDDAPDGLLPQAYGEDPSVPDASSLFAVAFGLLDRHDPRAGRMVDGILEQLGAGPFLHRYPPGRDDGFSGEEGAFLPVSFLAVTALAVLGRVEEARARLDRMCGALPRLLSEEVDPVSGRLLGNAPLVWSHAELARALYVLDAAERRERWGTAGLWAWKLQRYVRLRVASERDAG